MKKVLAIHDLAGFGRSSLTTVISVLSAGGVQCVPAPTAIFSTHTGIKNYRMQDISSFLDEYIEHFSELKLKFNAIYSGFLGNENQIESVILACDKFKDAIKIIDPVMGDEGKIYETYTPKMCEKMKNLIKIADIITPNITEVKILLDMPLDYKFNSLKDIEKALFQLTEKGAKTVIISGIHLNKDKILTAYNIEDKIYFYETEYINDYFPGTGDLFASVLTLNLVLGNKLKTAIENSCHLVLKAIKYTISLKENYNYGVVFEPLLCDINSINK